MNTGTGIDGNVREVVPFLHVSREESLRYYIQGLHSR